MAINISEKQIRSGWKVVSFGDIAKQCTEKVDRENNPFERYIEGGHMDSENLHITRWGIFGDDYVGPAFHRIFRKGQILYGSRRTYLKKVAVAEFDGITANTTFVIESQKPEILLPGLLPFIMLSDSFTSHSVLNSKGSTNPYINWKDIAKYELVLPPIERQQELLEILDKIEQNYLTVESLIKSITTLLNSLKIKISKGLSFNKNETEVVEIKLSDLCHINYGKSPTKIIEENGKFNVWGTGGITGKTNEILCDKPAILLGRKGTINCPQLINEPFWAIDTTFYCTMKNSTNVDWLFWYLSSIDLSIYNEASGVPSLSRTTLNNIKVPLPSPNEQQEQLRIINEIKGILLLKQSSKINLLSMRQKLLTHFFSRDT